MTSAAIAAGIGFLIVAAFAIASYDIEDPERKMPNIPQSKWTQRTIDAVAMTIGGLIAAVILVALVTGAVAQEQHGHPPADAQMHEEFYRHLKRPDQPDYSCCNLHDCYPTQARWRNGGWQAQRREDGKWLNVPASKINKEVSPNGQAHLCASVPQYDLVFCFVPPEAGA